MRNHLLTLALFALVFSPLAVVRFLPKEKPPVGADLRVIAKES